jgi:hypothetical protein
MENEAEQLQWRLTPLFVYCWLLYASWRVRMTN